MNYGQNTQASRENPHDFDQVNFTAGVGSADVDNNPMESDSLNSARFFPGSVDHSRLGNTALNAPEISKPTESNSVPTAIPFMPEPDVELGQITDVVAPQVNQRNHDIENSAIIQHFKDGKASLKDVKELKDAIDNLARDESNSDNAAEIYEFRRAACEALEEHT